jgi:hypothetical protein
MTAKTVPATAAAPHNPPHGGSWLRKPDGSLELLTPPTAPAAGRVPRDSSNASAAAPAVATETPKE